MARRQDGPGRGTSRELLTNGEPPPSTLAAQLLNRMEGDRGDLNQDEDTFAQLLREVLEGEDDPSSSANDPELILSMSCKLVFVILKAGIEPLHQQNPFTRREDQIQRASNSLKAITMTIGRNAGILYKPVSVNSDLIALEPPMLLWLIPRLLSLLHLEQCEEVKLECHNCLVSLLLTETKTHFKGVKRHTLLKYLQGCIRDVLNWVDEIKANSDRSFDHLTMPSQETLVATFPSFVFHDGFQKTTRTVLKNDNTAIRVVINILEALSLFASAQQTAVHRPLKSPVDLEWMLQTLCRIANAASGDIMDPHPFLMTGPLLLSLLNVTMCVIGHPTQIYNLIHDHHVRFIVNIFKCILLAAPLPLSSEVEISLCHNFLCMAHNATKTEAHSWKALTDLEALVQHNERYNKFGADLKHCLAIIGHCCAKAGSSPQSDAIQKCYVDLREPSLRASCRDFFGVIDQVPLVNGAPRPSKRLRTLLLSRPVQPSTSDHDPLSQIFSILEVSESAELTRLCQASSTHFSALSDDKQCALFHNLSSVPCKLAAGGRDSPGDNVACSNCDPDTEKKIELPIACVEADQLLETFVSLSKQTRSFKSKRSRVAAMDALHRILSHVPSKDALDLSGSYLGQYCMGALRSSVRELRISAGHVLCTFITDPTNSDTVVKNRVIALDYLRNLSEHGAITLQETCILAFGQVARNIEDGDEMNLVLLKLVEYLGNPNALLSGLAYDELQMISNHSPYTALKIFAPYWRTIAVTVVQNLQSRPQMAQHLSDLLAKSVDSFLLLTQVHVIPYFVLRKRHDVLQRIADASKQSIMTICRDHSNMAATLSTILFQASGDVEKLVINLLNSVSPEFNNVDCSELLRSEPQATATELLKFAGELDDRRRPMAHQGLQFLANITHGKPASSRGTRNSDVIGPFFENHVLGVMAILADCINDGKGPQPVLEKKRCLRAIGEMIKLAKAHVSNGLPQICACLRSAIENKDLSNDGFEAWIIMMSLLSEDDISGLLEPTIAIIVQYWDDFHPLTQQHTYDMLGLLFKSHQNMIRDLGPNLPSLAQIPLLSKYEADIIKLKSQRDAKHRFSSYCQRLQSENPIVVDKALQELADYLRTEQSIIHEIATSEQPDAIVGDLTRSLLDVSVLFSKAKPDVAVLCARCLGLVGCLDPTKIETVRDKRDTLIISNFTREGEVRDFIVSFLQEVLVKAFLSATNSRSQGFLAYAMQELLLIGDFEPSIRPRSRDAPIDSNYHRWNELPESMRTLLTPFLTSRYFVTAGVPQAACTYPIFRPGMGHAQWLRSFTFDLLKKDVGSNTSRDLFQILSRIIRFQDTSIATFLIPFAVLNVIVCGSDTDRRNIAAEMQNVLALPLPEQPSAKENAKLCSQTIFEVLDYLSRWMQRKKKEIANSRNPGTRNTRSFSSEDDLERDAMNISSLEAVLGLIPADIISRRAVECYSYARALFHWEQFIKQERQKSLDVGRSVDLDPYYERLQNIYTQIDEPDGIEGIASHLYVLNDDQQILEHRKAGRWTAVQSWYEMLLAETPEDLDVQYHLLTALKESGQHDVLLNQVDGLIDQPANRQHSLPLAAEACWTTAKYERLEKYVDQSATTSSSFNIGIGQILLALANKDNELFANRIQDLQRATAQSLTATNTSSLQECQELMLQCHVLAEIEAIGKASVVDNFDKSIILKSFSQRLDIIGPFFTHKQYVLGLRRAAMELSNEHFSSLDVASAWLTSAQLARKADFSRQAFSAMLHASQRGDSAATIEHARLLWKGENHRKAIRSLEGAIASNAFSSYSYTEKASSMSATSAHKSSEQNPPKALAQLLLAKWIDRAGQTQSHVIIQQYKNAVASFNRWERGHFHLGKHYNKLLESEKAKPPAKQAQTFITGETAKLVIENFLRALGFGAKYTYQALPRILTLWLTLSADTEKPLDPKYGNEELFRSHVLTQRKKLLTAVNTQVKKYVDRLPAWVYYTALSQIVARVCHPNQTTQGLLIDIVAKVVFRHPPQALWTLLAMIKSSNKERANRGMACMTRTLELCKRFDSDSTTSMRTAITQGQRLSDQLLHVCEGDIEGKGNLISISKDLGFKHSTGGSQLAVPIEASLTASLPTSTNVPMNKHKAFNADYVRIVAFMEDVLVLNSLQKPRKISMRGSDGRVYALLCKPKDDLRKDQRLMEFNAMINRSLKKDADSSKRRLYIKTYAVTPLNEACGLIEWIDGLRTLRDILINSYKQKSVPINYVDIRNQLTESISAPEKLSVFTHRVLAHFPPVFYEWFIEMFPEPTSWFAARLRYTRSCAVMSIVGHVLGLGDRHGENILFEESNGGTFHVDFNCLFDKGLTFEKPELVPFRLTHNMVDAFGAYGYEGPFRKSAELTMRICRQQEDTLMTILETFLYDPTTDFIGKKKRRETVVPETPEGVLENVRMKVRGLLPAESVPLSCEGYVDELIKQATDPFKLASMYIGWCPFF